MGSLDGKLALDREMKHAGGPPSDCDPASVIGRRIVMNHQGAAPNIIVGATQLISARCLARPRQWLITLMPPVTGDSGVLPWISTFDGTATFPPNPPQIFTAPVLPQSTRTPPALRCALRWGAGGVAWETQFDYPAHGGAFGVTADVIDLNVALAFPSDVGYATLGAVPILGAFMVEGQAADPTPLRWTEVFSNNIPAATVKAWAVKPYARALRLVSTDATALVSVTWLDALANVLWLDVLPFDAAGARAVLAVPSQAVAVKVGSTAAVSVNLEWQLGLV